MGKEEGEGWGKTLGRCSEDAPGGSEQPRSAPSLPAEDAAGPGGLPGGAAPHYPQAVIPQNPSFHLCFFLFIWMFIALLARREGAAAPGAAQNAGGMRNFGRGRCWRGELPSHAWGGETPTPPPWKPPWTLRLLLPASPGGLQLSGPIRSSTASRWVLSRDKNPSPDRGATQGEKQQG